jgi:hypothetical protein
MPASEAGAVGQQTFAFALRGAAVKECQPPRPPTTHSVRNSGAKSPHWLNAVPTYQNGSFAVRTDFAQIPTPSTSLRVTLSARRFVGLGVLAWLAIAVGLLSVSPIFNYVVMPVARTLSPTTRQSHQPDAA